MAAPGCIRDLSYIFGMKFQNTFMQQEVDEQINYLIKKHGTKDINLLTQQLYTYLSGRGYQLAAVEAAAKKRNLAIQTKKNLENFVWLTETFRGKEYEGLYALLTGSEKLKEGSHLSVDAQQHSLTGYYQQGVLNDLTELGNDAVNMLASHEPVNDMQVIRAMASLTDQNVTFTGDKKFIDIAKVLLKWEKISKDDANRHGAFIGTLPGYIMRQNHNAFNIQKAGELKWINDIYSRLDWDKTAEGLYSSLGEAERKTFLQEVYRNLTIGRYKDANKSALAHYGAGKIGSTASKMSQGRVLHFETPEAWYEYNALYGDGNLMQTYMTSLQRMAHDTALMKVLGPSPEAGFERLKQSLFNAQRASGNEKGAFDMWRWNKKLNNVFDEVSGKINTIENPTMAWFGSSMRALQDMIKLGGATITSFVDIGNVGAEFAYQGHSLLGSMARTLGNIVSLAGTKAERLRVLSQLGVTIDSYLGDICARIGGDMAPGKLAEIHRRFFKYNLLTQWTDRMRMSAGMGMAHLAAQERGLMFHELPAAKQRLLRSYKIQDWEWNEIIRLGQVEKFADGTEFLTPNAVSLTSDADIASVMASHGLKVDPNAIELYRDGLVDRYRTFFSDRVRYAVLEPNAGTRAVMRQGTHKGTVEGELLRFMGQFKSFPVAFLRQILGREYYGRMGTKGWGVSSSMSLARMILLMTGLGYMSMSIKQMMKGLEPRDPKDPKTWVAAMVQGGGAGILGDFMFAKSNRFGGGFWNTMGGPTVGMINDLYNIYANVREGEGKMKEVIKFGFNNTPLLNLFYVKEPIMYMFGYALQEWADPGSFNRYQKRLYKEHGQTYFWGRPWGL